jgi:L-alanine-DL-glutamate epimerase-like enolase superfamily enzyme
MQPSPAFQSIQATALDIPFKRSFGGRVATGSLCVRVKAADGTQGLGEGCLREQATGESLHDAQAFVAARAEWWQRRIGDIDDLAGWVRAYGIEIDGNPAAWTAVELALLDLFGKRAGRPVEAVLGLPPLHGRFRYVATVDPLSTAEVVRARNAGFRDFHVVLTGDRARDEALVDALRAAGISPRRVRAAAQNLWADARAAMDYLTTLDFAFVALEEPLAGRDYAGMARLARELDTHIVLDESVARADQMIALPGGADRWLVNVRISKMGGLLRSLEFVREARGRGLRVIVGACAGETSLLARASLVVASVAGDALAGQEGGHGTHLLERDIVEPSLRYGADGTLDVDTSGIGRAPGWGFSSS